jgi:hypothetical protein
MGQFYEGWRSRDTDLLSFRSLEAFFQGVIVQTQKPGNPCHTILSSQVCRHCPEWLRHRHTVSPDAAPLFYLTAEFLYLGGNNNWCG